MRRTSTIDTGWPEGFGKQMLVLGHARDVVTPRSFGPPDILAEDRFRVVLSPQREILEISPIAEKPQLSALVGARAGGHLRALLGDLIPGERDEAAPLYRILDDLSGASLVAGWIWSQWKNDWSTRLSAGPSRSIAGKRGVMTDICAGFAAGSSALREDGTSDTSNISSADVPSLCNSADPEGWHELFDHENISMRRARRIDLWREDEVICIEVGFQDSGLKPDGDRRAIHEYIVHATASAETFELLEMKVDPHVLPNRECVNAAPNAQQMVGQNLKDFRRTVLETLPGTLGCTHLNDVLRSLAEVPTLAARLPN